VVVDRRFVAALTGTERFNESPSEPSDRSLGQQVVSSGRALHTLKCSPPQVPCCHTNPPSAEL
jgi:hypothetical protein